MSKFYILKEELAYSSGIIDESNPAPEGAVEYKNNGLFNKAIKEIEEIVIKQNENFGGTESTDTKSVLKERYTVKELKAILKEADIKGYSKLKEEELIDLIIENGLA